MNVTLLGATGALGTECTRRCLEAGHTVTILARTPSKLPAAVRERVDLVEGDALDADAVGRAVPAGTDAVLFAIGIDRHSPEDLCTDATRHVLAALRRNGGGRFVWCGGGSTPVAEDTPSLGGRFVEFFASTFMGLRHRDKLHQLELLEKSRDVAWIGLRPLQMNALPRRDRHRIGFDRFSGLSKIGFADCAHAMVAQLDDDTWLHKAPIIQY